MQQIFRSTPPDSFTKAAQVSVLGFKDGTSRSSGRKKFIGKTFTKGQSLIKYSTCIEVDAQKKVHLSCSCDDFTFRWEHALQEVGSADIRYSNGEKPGLRNPGHVKGCCKHIVALWSFAQEKGLVT
jgi:hypothetical protein